jgi:hypothetical protein
MRFDDLSMLKSGVAVFIFSSVYDSNNGFPLFLETALEGVN